VALAQEVIPPRGKLLLVRRHERPPLAPPDEETILVAEFHQRHRRVVGIREVRERVDVLLEQLGRVLLLQLDEARVEARVGLCTSVELLAVGDPIARLEGAVVQQVEVGVDSSFLQSGDPVVECAEAVWMEVPRVALVAVDDTVDIVKMVQPDHVEACAGKHVNDLVDGGVVHEQAAPRHIDAEEPRPAALLKVEMAVCPHTHEAVLPGGCVQQLGEVGQRGIGEPGVPGIEYVHGRGRRGSDSRAAERERQPNE